jgi:hypothetical protein
MTISCGLSSINMAFPSKLRQFLEFFGPDIIDPDIVQNMYLSRHEYPNLNGSHP